MQGQAGEWGGYRGGIHRTHGLTRRSADTEPEVDSDPSAKYGGYEGLSRGHRWGRSADAEPETDSDLSTNSEYQGRAPAPVRAPAPAPRAHPY